MVTFNVLGLNCGTSVDGKQAQAAPTSLNSHKRQY
jgi:hypothetical protein